MGLGKIIKARLIRSTLIASAANKYVQLYVQLYPSSSHGCLVLGRHYLTPAPSSGTVVLLSLSFSLRALFVGSFMPRLAKLSIAHQDRYEQLLLDFGEGFLLSACMFWRKTQRGLGIGVLVCGSTV